MALTPITAEITYEVAAPEKAQPGQFRLKGAYVQAYGLVNTAFAGGMLRALSSLQEKGMDIVCIRRFKSTGILSRGYLYPPANPPNQLERLSYEDS